MVLLVEFLLLKAKRSQIAVVEGVAENHGSPSHLLMLLMIREWGSPSFVIWLRLAHEGLYRTLLLACVLVIVQLPARV